MPHRASESLLPPRECIVTSFDHSILRLKNSESFGGRPHPQFSVSIKRIHAIQSEDLTLGGVHENANDVFANNKPAPSIAFAALHTAVVDYRQRIQP